MPKQRTDITGFVKKAYYAYFKVKLGDMGAKRSLPLLCWEIKIMDKREENIYMWSVHLYKYVNYIFRTKGGVILVCLKVLHNKFAGILFKTNFMFLIELRKFNSPLD